MLLSTFRSHIVSENIFYNICFHIKYFIENTRMSTTRRGSHTSTIFVPSNSCSRNFTDRPSDATRWLMRYIFVCLDVFVSLQVAVDENLNVDWKLNAWSLRAFSPEVRLFIFHTRQRPSNGKQIREKAFSILKWINNAFISSWQSVHAFRARIFTTHRKQSLFTIRIYVTWDAGVCVCVCTRHTTHATFDILTHANR